MYVERRLGIVMCLALGVVLSSVAEAKGVRSSSRGSSSASRSHNSAPERANHDININLRSGSSPGSAGGDSSPGIASGGSVSAGASPRPAEPKLSPDEQRKRAEKQEMEETTANDFWEKRKADRARLAEEARAYAEHQKLPRVQSLESAPPVARSRPDGPASAQPPVRCVYKAAMSDVEIAACRNAR